MAERGWLSAVDGAQQWIWGFCGTTRGVSLEECHVQAAV